MRYSDLSMRSLVPLSVVPLSLGLLAMSATARAAPPCNPAAAYRSADGSCNSLALPERGRNETPFIRRSGINRLPDKADPLSGTDFQALGLPVPRVISNQLAQHWPNSFNEEQLSIFFVIMGQFIAHDFADLEVDLGAFPQTGDPADSRTGSFPGMLYPAGDPGILDLALAQQQGFEINDDIYVSMHTSQCYPGFFGHCQFVNRITHYLDASNIYGSDDFQAAGLRTFQDGLLRTASYDIPIFGAPPFVPPVHLDDMPVTYADGCNNLRKVLTLVQGVPDELVTCVGDSRGHENVMLTTVHIIWMREHNRRAAQLLAAHPGWDDEKLYQEARKWTSALYSRVLYDQWLPALLGSQSNALSPYYGYKPWVDPRVDLAFATAGFRIGHTMVPEIVTPRDECLESTIAAPPPFNVLSFAGGTGGPIDIFVLLGLTQGIDPVIRDMSLMQAFAVDPRVEDSIRDIPGSSVTFDTLATNINRGRMNGIESYVQLRLLYREGSKLVYGTPGCALYHRFTSADDPIACFTRITGTANLDLAETLRSLYGKAHKIDAWAGMMSEPHPPGSALGPTAAGLIADQFSRFRDGDRFYYENGHFSGAELAEIQGTSLRDIVMRNASSPLLLPPQLFFAPPAATHDDYKAPSCSP